MRLCSHGLRIGLFGNGDLLKVQGNNQLLGPIGKLYQQLIFSKKPGNCTIRLIPVLSRRSIKDASAKNSTWFYMLRNNLLDLVWTKEKLGSGDDRIEATNMADLITVSAGQFMKPRSSTLDFSHFLIENVHLLIFTVLGYLLIAAVVVAVPRLVHLNYNSRLKSLKLILTRTMIMDPTRLPSVHLKLVFLFFNLFFFFFILNNFLAGGITTQKVLIPTDEICNSPSKLIATSKTIVFGDGEEDIVKGAPKNSFLDKLSKKNFLVLDSFRDFVRMQKELNNYVFFTNPLLVVFLTRLLSEHVKKIGSVAFIDSTDFYERLSVLQMRKGLDPESKRFVNSRMDASGEFGFYITIKTKLKELLLRKVKGNLEVYESVEDLVQDISQKASPDIKLYNIQKLFFYFGGILVLFLFIFIVEHFLSRLLGKTNPRQVSPFRRRSQFRESPPVRQYPCTISRNEVFPVWSSLEVRRSCNF